MALKKKHPVQPGTVWADKTGNVVLVGRERDGGKYDLWRLVAGGWAPIPRLYTAERVISKYPTLTRSRQPIPVGNGCRDWETAYHELLARHGMGPTADDNRAGYAALVGQAETELAAVKADNAVLVDLLRRHARRVACPKCRGVGSRTCFVCDNGDVPHFTAEVAAALEQPHPGAALLERLRTLEAWVAPSLSSLIQDLLAMPADALREAVASLSPADRDRLDILRMRLAVALESKP